jgi:hypothetical protein
MLWRFFSALLLLTLAQGAIAEDPVPTGKQTYRPEQLRDPDVKLGVHLDFSWKTEKAADVDWLPVFSCVNECKGKVHAKHQECDLSCDKRCGSEASFPGRKGHIRYLESSLEDRAAGFDAPPAQSNLSTLDRAFTAARLPSSSRAEWYLGSALKTSLERLPQGRRVFEPSLFDYDHFNETPCSLRSLEMANVRYNVTVDYSLSETTKEGNAYKTGPAVMGQLFFVLHIPDATRVRVSEPTVSCQCEPVQTPPTRTGFLPRGKGMDQYAFVLNNDMMRPVTAMDLTSTVSGIVANDMNTASLTLMPPAVGELFIPAGWELQSVGGEGQNLQLQEDLDLRFGWNLFANTNGGLAPKTVRVMCLEITKPEPRPEMKYRLVPPGNPLIARLSALTKAARVRGPWDQMRLWIATDAAPYEKIAKTLVPAPGQGTYVREMYRAATVGAVSPYESRYAAIMDLKLLLAKNYDPAAVRWFLAAKLRTAPEETLAWFARATSSDWGQVLDRGTPKEDEALVGLLVAGLAQGGGAKEAVQVLGRLPEEHRQAVTESAGLRDAFVPVLMGSDAGAASAVLDWLLLAKPSYAAVAAAQLNPGFPEALQAKAKAIS